MTRGKVVMNQTLVTPSQIWWRHYFVLSFHVDPLVALACDVAEQSCCKNCHDALVCLSGRHAEDLVLGSELEFVDLQGS